MTVEGWEERVAAFWEDADDRDPGAVLARMKALVDERPVGDPDALYEWASVHDFLGMEADAVPLYRAALDAALTGERHARAVVQLASSLRNVGEAARAADLLRAMARDEALGSAPDAFLALALHDLGHHREALHVALKALAANVPAYSGAISAYADDLLE